MIRRAGPLMFWQYAVILNGGKRQWSIVVDGASVGELKQSWQHPRWWPPIEWNASPSALFKGWQVTFRLVDGPR